MPLECLERACEKSIEEETAQNGSEVEEEMVM